MFTLQSPNEVYAFMRPVDLSAMKNVESGAHVFLRGGLRSSRPKRQNCVSLLSANQVVRALPPSKVPLKEIYPKGQSSTETKSERSWVFFITWQIISHVQSVDLCSGLSFRCYNFTDGSFPGGDWSELKKSQIYSHPKVSTTHPLPVRHIWEAVLLNQEMSYWTFISQTVYTIKVNVKWNVNLVKSSVFLWCTLCLIILWLSGQSLCHLTQTGWPKCQSLMWYWLLLALEVW